MARGKRVGLLESEINVLQILDKKDEKVSDLIIKSKLSKMGLFYVLKNLIKEGLVRKYIPEKREKGQGRIVTITKKGEAVLIMNKGRKELLSTLREQIDDTSDLHSLLMEDKRKNIDLIALAELLGLEIRPRLFRIEDWERLMRGLRPLFSEGMIDIVIKKKK